MRYFVTTLLSLFFCAPALAVNLFTVYQIAKHNDATFLQAKNTLLARAENKTIALAKFLPQISLNANATHGNNDNSSALVTSSNTNFYNYNASLTQNIFNLSDWLNVQQASLQQKAVIASLVANQQDLRLRVMQAYFSLAKAQENLNLQYFALNLSRQELQQTRYFYRAGLKDKIALSNAKASYDLSRHNLVSQQQRLQVAKAALYQITKSHFNHYQLLQHLSMQTPHNLPHWLHSIAKKNPTIVADRYQAHAAFTAINATASQRLPSLSAQLSYNVSRTTGNSIGLQRSRGTSAELNLSFPIFQGGQLFAQTTQARYTYRATQQQLEKDYYQQRANAIQYFHALQHDINNIHIDRHAVKSNQLALNNTLTAYKAGQATFFDLVQARQNLISAKANLINDRYQYLTDQTHLNLAVGNLSIKGLLTINRDFS